MKKFILINFMVFVTFLVSGCNSDEASKARLMGSTNPPLRYNLQTKIKKVNKTEEKIKLINAETAAKARLAEIEAKKEASLKEIERKKATEIARLEAQKAQKIKELELEQTRSTNAAKAKMEQTRSQTQIAIEKERQTNLLAKQKADLTFYRQLTMAIIAVILLLMLFVYLLYRHRQNLKLKLHEEELKHKAYLQESRQHHERVTKMLEIISSDNTDKNLKKELTKLLKDAGEKPIALPQSNKK